MINYLFQRYGQKTNATLNFEIFNVGLKSGTIETIDIKYHASCCNLSDSKT